MAERIMRAIGVSGGIGIGKAWIYRKAQNPEMNASIAPENAQAELLRFHNALDTAARQLDQLILQSEKTVGKEQIGIIKGQKGIYMDPAYKPAIEKMIGTQFSSAEKAVNTVTEQFAVLFENMKNDYMKERAADVRDAGRRLLNVLSNNTEEMPPHEAGPVVLIADDLSPSDTIRLSKSSVCAFVTRRGGKTSHASIFARAMGLPALAGLNGIDEISAGDEVIVDGDTGVLVLRPDEKTSAEYRSRAKSEKARRETLLAGAQNCAVLKSGKQITVAANIGSAEDAENSLSQGADGCGLFRTEYLYLSGSGLPGEEEQYQVYKKVAELYGKEPVIIRTLDIGGDKALPSLGLQKEENPFLGFRAIRVCLARKDLFLTQLRAILRAGVFGNLRIMFPMISGLDELRAAKEVLKEAKSQLRRENLAFCEGIQTGIMIEIPSAVLMADALAEECDFFSIGTNDLVQYTLATDRGNEKVSYLYDYFHPAVLRMIQMTVLAAHAKKIPVGVCGSMGGDENAVPLLVGLGIDEVSMPAASIPEVKSIVRKLTEESCRELAAHSTSCKTPQEVRNLLASFQF